MLERWYESGYQTGKRRLSPSAVRQIFEAYFGDSITFNDGEQKITDKAIVAQLSELKRDGDASTAWREVFLDTDFRDPDSNWTATRNELAAIAKELGINIRRKAWEDKYQILMPLNTPPNTHGKKRKRNLGEVTAFDRGSNTGQGEGRYGVSAIPQFGLLTPPETSLSDTQESGFSSPLFNTKNALLSTPTKLAKRRKTSTNPYTWGSVSRENGVFFRFHDDQSQGLNTAGGFRAGLFEINSEEAPPPNRSTDAFLNPVEVHLRRLCESTPFISIWESFLPALHRLLRSSANNAQVSMVNVHHILATQSPETPRISHVPSVYRELQSRGRFLDMKYSGTSEHLVWDRIKREDILATFSVSAFRAYIQDDPSIERLLRLEKIRKSQSSRQYSSAIRATALPLSTHAGRTIGGFLAFTGLPKAYVDIVACKMAWVWRFTGFENHQRKEQFLKGVQCGFSEYFETIKEAASEAVETSTGRRCLDECGDDLANNDEFMLRRKGINIALGQCGKTGRRVQSNKPLKGVSPVSKQSVQGLYVWKTLTKGPNVHVYSFVEPGPH